MTIVKRKTKDDIVNFALYGIGKPGGESASKEFLKRNGLNLQGSDSDIIWKSILAREIFYKGAQQLQESILPNSDPAPSQIFSECTPQAAKLIAQAAKDKRWGLVREGFLLLQKSNQVIHPLVLPIMLESLETSWSSIPGCLDCLGTRSIWLSHQNPEWQWFSKILHPDITSAGPVYRQKYTLQRSTDIEAANNLLTQSWSEMNRSDRSFFLDLMAQDPHPSDIDLLEPLLTSRSRKEREKVLSILLTIPSFTHAVRSHEAAANFTHLTYVGTNRRSKRLPTSLPQDLPFRWSDLALHSEYFTNPMYRLVAITPPSILIEGLSESPQKICSQLIQCADNERLCQAFVLSASKYADKDWITMLSNNWLKTYPSESTIAIDFRPIFAELQASPYNDIITSLINREDHSFEKLHLICQGNPHYINLKNSRGILDLILEILQIGIKHNEKLYLEKWLLSGSEHLDPRVYPYFNTKWHELEPYFMQLPKALLTLKNNLADRFTLFSLITKRE